MANKYGTLAKEIVANVGGSDNIESVTHCMTRLRFVLKDEELADSDHIKNMNGVIQVIRNGGQFQVVIGQQVSDVYNEVVKLEGIQGQQETNLSESKEGGKSKKKNLAGTFVSTITGIFSPILGALAAAGMLKGILIVLSTVGVITADSGSYRILYAAADSIYTFLPVFLAYTSAKKFGANQFVSVIIAGALVYPDLTAAYAAGTTMSFFGIPVVLISYTSTVLPIIIAVYAQSKLEKLMRKVLPGVLRDLLYPVISMIVIVPATYLVIGPITDWLGSTLAAITATAMEAAPIPVGFIFCGLWPLAVMIGIHWGFIAVGINTMAISGRETMVSATGPLNFAQAGATLGVFLKTKNKPLKEISGQAFLAAFLAGITEPAMYGVTLKYKKPFYFVMFFSGVAGAIIAAVGGGATAFASLSILTWGTYMGKGFTGFVIACLIAFFGPMICTYFFGFNDGMLEEGTKEVNTREIGTKEAGTVAADNITKELVIGSPMRGRTLPLSEVKDEAFSTGAMGDGIAIEPKEGKVIAPFDGELAVLFPSKHALGLRSEEGVEILIHIGFDTVNLNGKYFEAHVEQGQHVKRGQTLVTFNLEKIREEGYDVQTPILITDMAAYKDMEVKNSDLIDYEQGLLVLK